MDEKEIRKFSFDAMSCQMENSKSIMFFKDRNLDYVMASRGFLDLIGYSYDYVVGMSDFDFFSPELASKYIRDEKEIILTGIPLIDEIEFLQGATGNMIYCSSSKYPIKDNEGNVVGIYGICKDMTTEMALEEEKERGQVSHQYFEDVLEGDITKNVLVNFKGNVWSQKVNIPDDCSFSQIISIISENLVHPKYRKMFEDDFSIDRLLSIYECGIRGFDHVTYLSDTGSDYQWTSFFCQMHNSNISETLKVTLFLKDLNEEIKIREELKKTAETDPLTGVFNRNGILNAIEKGLLNIQHPENPALLFLDLDKFKHINDTYGHLVGDGIIAETGKILNSLCEEGDCIGRIGGDEFIIYIRDIGDVKNIDKFTNKVINGLRNAWKENKTFHRVTYSVGVTVYKEGKSLRQLYSEADSAMYRSKAKGGDSIEVFI